MVSVTACFVTKATPVHKSFVTFPVVQVQYHVNIIYNLGGGPAYTHTHAHAHTIDVADKSNFKKPGAPGLITLVLHTIMILEHNNYYNECANINIVNKNPLQLVLIIFT